MLNRVINSIERLGSLGGSGGWLWRIVGGAISLTIMVVILMLLR